MIHYWGNVIEGFLWIGIAGIIYFRAAKRTDEGTRRIAGRAVLAFSFFGISDFIEAGTGAWYRPIWLFAMKSVCVVVLVHCLVRYNRIVKERSEDKRTNRYQS